MIFSQQKKLRDSCNILLRHSGRSTNKMQRNGLLREKCNTTDIMAYLKKTVQAKRIKCAVGLAKGSN